MEGHMMLFINLLETPIIMLPFKASHAKSKAPVSRKRGSYNSLCKPDGDYYGLNGLSVGSAPYRIMDLQSIPFRAFKLQTQ